jgi:oligoendopeptidase F
MFASGYPGAPWQFFSMSYNGYLREVMGLAHESGHAVHFKMLTNAGVRPLYSDGPDYVTEAVAMTNELLLAQKLYENETDLRLKAYYLEQLLENALALMSVNMFAHLELKIYEGVAEGTIKDADDLDRLCLEMISPYSIYYEQHPEYGRLWSIIHHYYDVPMYNVSYVIAQSLALVLMERIAGEPGFTDRYAAMLRSGFDRPAPELIRETTGVDMLDPAVLRSGFSWMEDKIAELEELYARL